MYIDISYIHTYAQLYTHTYVAMYIFAYIIAFPVANVTLRLFDLYCLRGRDLQSKTRNLCKYVEEKYDSNFHSHNCAQYISCVTGFTFNNHSGTVKRILPYIFMRYSSCIRVMYVCSPAGS